MKKSLSRTEVFYRHLAELIPEAVVIHVNGIIVYANPAAAKFISAEKREDLMGKSITQFIHPDSREFIEKRLRFMMEKNEVTPIVEEKFISLTGETIIAEVNGVPFTFRGQPAILTILQNITERKTQERQKDEFMGIVSHELKTPLTSLKAYGQILQRQFAKKGDKKSAEQLGKMDAQVDKLIGLIGDLLDATKVEADRLVFQYKEFHFDKLVNEILEEMQRTTDKHKIVKRGKVNDIVMGDRERVGQVIINLLSNAIKYSPDANEIIVTTQVINNHVTCSVKDFGIGISKEQQTHIFEKFYRENGEREITFPGLGLGLYISAVIVKRMSGKIWVEGEKGRGSTFSFSLPFHSKN